MKRVKRVRGAALALGAVVIAAAGCGSDDDKTTSAGLNAKAGGTMILATTTSTKDSGLLDELVPAFQASGRCSVKTVAVGSGQALELGARGDADVLLVHSPADEESFMKAGDGVSRIAVMHNDFVVVGPKDDPAGVKGASATDAFQRIASAKERFASRGDDSGTNAKELKLWKQAAVKPKPPWYFETGQGMGETLQIASQRGAYTLSDRGTYLATKNLDSALLVQGGAELRNPYHVIVVKHAGTNRGCAQAFSTWITSPATQRKIGTFGVKDYGQRLFTPDARSG